MFLNDFNTSTLLLNYIYFSIATLTAIFFGTLFLRSNQRHFLNEAAEAALLEHRDAKRQVKQKTKLREKYLEEKKTKKKKGGINHDKKNKDGTSELPPGQVEVSKWIVLDLGRPSSEIFDYTFGNKWKLDSFYVHPNHIGDLLGSQQQLQQQSPNATFDSSTVRNWIQEYGKLRRYKMDWHCVTGWTTRDVILLGLPFEFVLSKLLPSSSSSQHEDASKLKWEWMVQVSADGYAAPVYRGDIFHKNDETNEEVTSDSFLCVGMIDPNNGNDEIIPLPEERGTIRFVFPNLYGWKSVKCLREVHFLPRYVDGLWEKLGTHPRGRWEYNERWKEQEANLGRWNTAFWNMAKKSVGFYRTCFGEHVYEIVMVGGGNIFAAWVRFAGFFAAQKPHHEGKL